MDKIARIIEGSGARILLERLSDEHIKEIGLSIKKADLSIGEIKLAIVAKWTAKGTDSFMRKYMDNPSILKALCVALGIKHAHSVTSSLVEKVSEKVTLLGLDTYSKEKSSDSISSKTVSLSTSASSLAPPSPTKHKPRTPRSRSSSPREDKSISPAPSPNRSRTVTPRLDVPGKVVKEQVKERRRSSRLERMDAGSDSEDDLSPLPLTGTKGSSSTEDDREKDKTWKKNSQSSSSEMIRRKENDHRE